MSFVNDAGFGESIVDVEEYLDPIGSDAAGDGVDFDFIIITLFAIEFVIIGPAYIVPMQNRLTALFARGEGRTLFTSNLEGMLQEFTANRTNG